MMKKSKHNFWIEGFEKGEIFFKWIMSFGYSVLILYCVVAVTLLLAFFGIVNMEYMGVVILLVRIMQLGMFMLVGGTILMYACKFIADILVSKELKELDKEGEKYVRAEKRKKSV